MSTKRKHLLSVFTKRLANARVKAQASKLLLDTSGVPADEVTYSLWYGWQEIDAAISIITGKEDNESAQSSDPDFLKEAPIEALTSIPQERFYALEEACKRYQTTGHSDLSRKDARQLTDGLIKAVLSLENWQHTNAMTREERYPFFYRRSTKIGLGVFLIALLVCSLIIYALQPGKDDGLQGTYFTQRGFTGKKFTRIDREIDFKWAGNPPMDGMPKNDFSVRWRGCVIVKKGEFKTLAAGADDGILVYINDKLIIDNGGKHGYKVKRADKELAPGVHRIRVEYTEWGGAARAFLGWTSGRKKPKPIPYSRLAPPGTNSKGGCPSL